MKLLSLVLSLSMQECNENLKWPFGLELRWPPSYSSILLCYERIGFIQYPNLAKTGPNSLNWATPVQISACNQGFLIFLIIFFPFVFSILWISHIGNHPQGELGKFGYRSEKKAQIFKNHTIFWRLALEPIV
jgi:hypothetical protein